MLPTLVPSQRPHRGPQLGGLCVRGPQQARTWSSSSSLSARGTGVLVAFRAVPAVPGVRGHADGCPPWLDGGLYTATRYEFRSLPDIRRNLHQRPLKTEESPLHWLNGETSPFPLPGLVSPAMGRCAAPRGAWSRGGGMALGSCVVCHERKLRQGGIPRRVVGPPSPPLAPCPPDAEFVASVLVRESKDSPVGDDDKIYYFFTEWAGEETTSFFDKSQVARVARVARVCKVGTSPATASQAPLLPAQGLGACTGGEAEGTHPHQPVQKCSLRPPRATWGERRSCSASGRPS